MFFKEKKYINFLSNEERIILFLLFLVFLESFLIFVTHRASSLSFFAKEIKNSADSSIKIFLFPLLILLISEAGVYFYITYRLLKRFFITDKAKKNFSIKRIAYNKTKEILLLTRKLIIFTLFFVISLIQLNFIHFLKKGSLENELIIFWEKIIWKTLPFLWFHIQENPLKKIFNFFEKFIIFSFDSLPIIMIAIGLFFYFLKNKLFFKRYFVSICLALTISMPFWYFFPVNSPNNSYLATHKLPASYRPTKSVILFEKRIRDKQKESPPISTIPSMHVIWAILVVYYLLRFNKKSAFISIPWLIFLMISTVYLAQHYLFDVMLSILLSLLIIIPTTNYLIKRN